MMKVTRDPLRALEVGAAVVRTSWPKLFLGSEKRWDELRRELRESGFLAERKKVLSEQFALIGKTEVRGHRVVPGHIRSLHAEMLYAIVRHRRPKIVVETGVCNGLSSAIILKAMRENGEGRLFSIDLPEFTDATQNTEPLWSGKGGAAVPTGKSVGWLVDESLIDRWELRIGRTQDLLLPLLSEVGPVDLFIHDSEHSYDNQLFEFTEGFAALNFDGVIVATDISWSFAYRDFVEQISGRRAKSAFVDPSCALVLKER